jgi:predicted O-linked N-acetylglucosamine transferase (SPINDLY family)
MATVPPEEDRWFTEKVLRLSGSRFCYTPPDYAPEVSEPPCLRTGLITFGSFNNLAKLNKEVVLTWARLLIAVPNSRLILKWHSLQDERIRDEYIMLFSAAGVHKDQLELRAGSSHAEMLQEYGDIDIALDPFPFSGGLTSLEALWMGVPVITLPLGSPASRQTVSFLLLLGLAGYVASNTDDYIAIAAAHAADVDRLAMTRSVLRLRVKRTLCDGISFMKQIDGIYHHIWEEYCVKHNNCRL